jgi:CBS domain-containing protein
MKLQVRHAMNRDPVTVQHDYTVREAARMMIDFGLETLIVTVEDEILGAVTYRDVLESLLAPGFDPDTATIGDLADEDVVMVRPTTALGDAAEIMLETDRGTLPVVDGELVGYVCFSDILKLIQGAYGEEEEEAEEEPFDPHNYIV